jgi:uncharacterized membrane protein YdcZ (DUF606 family)
MKLLIALFVIIAAIVGVYALGMYAQRRIKQRAPESQQVRPMRWYEVASGCLSAVFLFAGIAAYELAPESILGAFLHEPYGIPAAVIGGLIFLYAFGILVAVLKRPWENDHGA